jgi:hypothetical protein
MTKYFYNFHNEEEKPFTKGVRKDEWVKPEYKESYNSMIRKVVEAKKSYDLNVKNSKKRL